MNWFKSFWKKLALPAAVRERVNYFTPRAQQVLALAQKEACALDHNFVGTEHVLLGLIRLNQGVACNWLRQKCGDPEMICLEITKLVGVGPEGNRPIGRIPYTPGVKKVLALAIQEAKALNHTYVGTEHILLGLLRESDGVAGRVLQKFNVELEPARQEILKQLSPGPPPTELAEMTASDHPPDFSSDVDKLRAAARERINNFTPRSQRSLMLAAKEARAMNHNFVATEHILLGLIRLNQGTAFEVLKQKCGDPEKICVEIKKALGPGPGIEPLGGQIPYTPRVKKVLALAAKEARELNHTWVGTEHVLLGLLRENDGVAGRILERFNVKLEPTRQEVLKRLNPGSSPPGASGEKANEH